MNPIWNEAISHPWTFWVLAALVGGILELVLPSFSFIFASVAALFAALVSLKFGWVVQFEVFSIFLVVPLLLARPWLLSKLQTKKKLLSRTEILVGRSGKVTMPLEAHAGQGRVLVDGQDWAAISEHPIQEGKTIVVESSDGIYLKVREIPPTE